MKQTIRLTEGELKHIIKESVNTLLKEAVLPMYYPEVIYNDNEDDDGEAVIEKGDDMFPDDVLYKAEQLRKLTGNKLKIMVSADGRYYMYHLGSLSIESLELIIKGNDIGVDLN